MFALFVIKEYFLLLNEIKIHFYDKLFTKLDLRLYYRVRYFIVSSYFKTYIAMCSFLFCFILILQASVSTADYD